MPILFLSSGRAGRSARAATSPLLTAQAALRAGGSLVEVAQATGFPSVTLFSWRYYGYFGYWPTRDQRAPAARP